jgi:outer membrane murein-binding lipoprotein Lpp
MLVSYSDKGEVGTMMYKSHRHLLGAVSVAAMLLPGYAMAQDAQLQRQLDQLQSQVQSLQKQVAEQKKREAAEAQASAGGAYAASMPLKTKAPPLSPIKMTWGGFLAAESVYRQHNTVSDMGTPFTSIPYPFSPQYSEHEFRGSARASRISLLVEGTIDPMQKLSGYYEMDFLGTGITSNYNQSNSWDLRLRQAFLTYDNSMNGWHVMAGQGWSLVTQNTVGITPRKENVPLTIEANYLAGFDYTRNWQFRVTKDFGSVFWAAISIENPAEQVFGGSQVLANGLTAAATGNGAFGNNATFNGLIVNWANPGNSFLGSGSFANNFNTETAPDVIGKVALDPGAWGHFEGLGMVRFFTDSIFTCTVVNANGSCPLTAANMGSASSHVTTGWGVGGSALVHAVPKYVDLQASVLYGKGIGRYGASQLSDVVVAPDGTLSPITALHAMGGVVLHPWEGLDVYGYGGFEKADTNLFTLPTALVTGFGNPNVNNLGCGIVTGASFTGGASNCTAVNKEVDMVTVGFWQNLFKGSYGRVAAGLQWEYIQRKSFDTVAANGGTVSTSDNVFLTSLRYYPF